jgi:hypothetical protein
MEADVSGSTSSALLHTHSHTHFLSLSLSQTHTHTHTTLTQAHTRRHTLAQHELLKRVEAVCSHTNTHTHTQMCYVLRVFLSLCDSMKRIVGGEGGGEKTCIALSR